MDDNKSPLTPVGPEQIGEDPSCPECGATVLSPDVDGELVCEECGLVLEERKIDDGPEWRAFTQEQQDKKARTGDPVTYTRHDMGVSTEIGNGPNELSRVSGKKRAQYSRMQQWHSRRTRSKDRNLGFAFTELKRIGSQLTLPDAVQEEVARLYEKAVEQGLVKGRSMEGVLAALTYAVARKQGTPRTLEVIADASGTEARDIGRTYRYVARELGLNIKPAQPEDYLPRFAGELQLSGEVQARARGLIEQAREADLLAGKRRTGIAAAALYTAAVLKEETRTQEQVADAAGVTVVTLRNRYQELLEALGLANTFGVPPD